MMKKNEYMRLLKEKLNQFDETLQRDILEDYMRHFAEGELAGRSEEELIQELGDIDEMILELEDEINERHPIVEKKEIESDFFRGIKMNLEIGDVQLIPSHDNQLHIDTSGNLNSECYAVNQSEENGIFIFELKRKGFFRTFLKQWIKIKVALPLDYEMVEVKVGSGDIELKDIETDNLNCTSASGDINVNKSVLGNAQLKIGSGDLEIMDAEIDMLEIVCGSGSVEIDGKEIKCIEIKVGSGDVECRTASEEIRCKTGSGDVEIEAEQQCDVLVGTGSGDIDIKMKECTGAEISIVTVSGDAELTWKGEELSLPKKFRKIFESGGCRIGAKTASGDISIECE